MGIVTQRPQRQRDQRDFNMAFYLEMNILLEKAIVAALKAGEEILKIYNDPDADFQIEAKADNSPLTIADRTSHDVIESFLESTPYPVLSEEGKTIAFNDRQDWDTLWIVDPLDGTKEFIKKNGEFTVNIALVKDGVPVLGVIYVPVTKELYYGCEEAGAYKKTGIIYEGGIDFAKLQDVATPLPIPKEDDSYVVVASRSHMSDDTRNFVEKLRQAHPNLELTSVGSSIKICLVAEGKADIYPRFAPTMEWDTAAGHAIARAAGKDIYQMDEETPLTYNKEDLLNPWFIVE